MSGGGADSRPAKQRPPWDLAMPSCIAWGEEKTQVCSETADQGYNECSQSEDQGYNSCSQTADQGYSECCTWWPCSWGCKALVWVSNVVCVAWTWVSNIVCVAWTWISNVVCVAWTWITTAVCVLWDVVTTIVNAILVTIESIVGWVLSAVAFVVELIEAIPFVGAIIRFIINVVTTIVVMAGSVVDFVLGAIGIRPEKILRVCTVILKDEKGNAVATNEVARQFLQLACDVYKRDANVRIVPSKAFQYNTGFAGAETVDDSWIMVDGSNSDSTLLDVPCGSANSALGLPASGFQLKASTLCFFGAWRRVAGYGAPVTCFIIRDVTDALGCQVMFTDYATIEGSLTWPPPSPRTLGHEVGHACLLRHRCVDEDNANMMGTQDECSPASTTLPDRANPRFSEWQVLVIRASKHVTYF